MFCPALIVKIYFEKMSISPFLTQIFLYSTYFPHFVPSINLQMLNTQNLPTLLYNVHKISVKNTLTQYNIAQYCWQELCCHFPYITVQLSAF